MAAQQIHENTFWTAVEGQIAEISALMRETETLVKRRADTIATAQNRMVEIIHERGANIPTSTFTLLMDDAGRAAF